MPDINGVETPLTLADMLAIGTILAEAGNQKIEGMIAVGEVIRNRSRRRYMSDGSIIGTILRPYQFSCWNNDKTNRTLMSNKLGDISGGGWGPQAIKALGAWQASSITNITDGSVLYHSVHVAPSWSLASNVCKKCQIGDHLFYNEIGL